MKVQWAEEAQIDSKTAAQKKELLISINSVYDEYQIIKKKLFLRLCRAKYPVSSIDIVFMRKTQMM